MDIILQNVQSIKHAEYNLPDKGLVQIVGGNSNGKSILAKAITHVASLSILDKEVRKGLITTGQREATIFMRANNQVLLVKLYEEASGCYMVLQRDADNKESAIRRGFEQGGLRELLNEFGFRCYVNDGLVLQCHETYGLMPFVNTPVTANGEMVESIATDQVAQSFLQNYKEITYKIGKDNIRALDKQISTLNTAKDALMLYDYNMYEDYDKKMTEFYKNLKNMSPVNLSYVPPAPKTAKLITIRAPKLRYIPYMKVYPYVKNCEDMSNIIRELSKIQSGVCPTCGKRLKERGVHACQ